MTQSAASDSRRVSCRGGIVPAGPAHAAVMAAVHGAACTLEAWDCTAFATQFTVPGTFGFLHPRGGMVLARVAADEADILTLAVLPTSRRIGLGRALMRATIGAAARAGATTMFLDVSASNPAGQGLYAGLGFAPAGRRPRYYQDGSDAIVLRRPISRDAEAGW